MVISWKDLGTVTSPGDYNLADGSIVTVTTEDVETAQEIVGEGTEPFVTLVTNSASEMPRRYRLGKFN